MANIYEISNFSAAANYSKNDIVIQGGNYRYALDTVTASAFDESEWGGIESDEIDGTVRPEFFWKPSFQSSGTHRPKAVSIQFGDGYSQRSPDGINSTLLSVNYTFDGCDERRAKAILHFLEIREGYETFLFTPHFPYGTQKRFVCKSWQDSSIFYNNYTINAEFTEVPI